MKIPKYIREILEEKAWKITVIAGHTDEVLPGYTIRLFGDWPRGYENQLLTRTDKLVAWAKRNHADAYIIKQDMWYDHYDTCSRAARAGFRNSVFIVITDPVMLALEKEGLVKVPHVLEYYRNIFISEYKAVLRKNLLSTSTKEHDETWATILEMRKEAGKHGLNDRDIGQMCLEVYNSITREDVLRACGEI